MTDDAKQLRLQIARISERVAKLEAAARNDAPGYTVVTPAKFMFDHENDEAPAWNLFIARGEKSVLLTARAVTEDHYITDYVNTITYSTATPSLDRARAGFRGELANDSSEHVVENVSVEDLIAALQWLVEKPPLKEDA